jgi:hypothetical protein
MASLRRATHGAAFETGAAMADRDARAARLEVASAIVLSLAALASSWASYQSGLWDGEQAAHYSEANALRIEASRVALEGDALASAQLQLFNAWLEAKASGDDALAAFYEARLPAKFRPAFDAWLATEPLTNPAAPQTPFLMEGFQRPGKAQADALVAKADQTFERGQYANTVSDAFQQSATLLALALFFGGIGQVFKSDTARVALLTVAVLGLAAGLLRLFSLPLQVLGLHALGGG